MGETERLTLREAAEVIGIPLDALRKRVYRGTIPAEKIDGQYTILASVARSFAPDAPRTADETVLGHGSDTGETPPAGLVTDYIASLKDEIAFLREQLDQRSRELAAERERADTITQMALLRIEALTAGDQHDEDTGHDTADEPSAGPGREDGAAMGQESHVASWWRRLIGRRG